MRTGIFELSGCMACFVSAAVLASSCGSKDDGTYHPPQPGQATTSSVTTTGGSGGGDGGGGGAGGGNGSGGEGGGEQQASCVDNARNGTETDIDCGGICAPCDVGQTCGDSGANCVTQVCTGGVCQAPSCTDSAPNGDETDIDCGGSCSGKCAAGQKCKVNGDCKTELCVITASAGVCACPAGMVIAPVAGGGSYCIDAYEVSRVEYDVFVRANPPLAGLPAACAANTVYAPSANWPPPLPTDSRPVTNVDWCDAYAYCKYSNKHLCGRVAGGSNDPGLYADPSQSEWFNACSGQGTSAYPYGNDFVGGTCFGEQVPPCGPLSRPTPPMLPPCLGGVTGLYNMSGNAAEWEDSCDAGERCRLRGGSCGSERGGMRCDVDETWPRLDNTRGDVGFRCCL